MTVRADVEAKMGGRVEQGVWECLENYSWLGGAPTVDDVCGEVRRLRRLIRTEGRDYSGTKSDAFAGSSVSPEPSDSAVLREPLDSRGELLGLYLAKRALPNSRVKALRDTYLDGKPLKPAQAYALLQSPAIQILDAAHFRAGGIPIVGHVARIVTPPKPEVFQKDGWNHRLLRIPLEISWPGGRLTESFVREERVPEGRAFTPPKTLTVPVSARRSRRMTVFSMSMIDSLREAVVDLTDRFPWTEQDAVMFVLTGQIAPVRRVQVQAAWRATESYNDPTIIMRVDATLRPQVVEASYRKARRLVLCSSRSRTPSPRTQECVRHVLKSLADLSHEPDWRALMESWNRRSDVRRKWRFRHPWRMRTMFNRGITSIAYPELRIENKPSRSQERGQA